MSDTLRDIEIWHERARPKPTDKDLNVSLGCHFEEVAEMLECIATKDSLAVDLIGRAYDAVKALSTALKTGLVKVVVTHDDRPDFLDALADQIVTAVGVGHCAKMDVIGACDRVNVSNWSKFVDGQPVFNSDGKVIKGPDYVPVDLRGLV